MKKILVLLNFLFLVCVTTYAEQVEIDSSNIISKHKILIASQKSKFKEAVVEKVRASLYTMDCFVNSIDLKHLRDESTEDYDAIVILNTIWARRLNGKVRKFFKNINENERYKVILISTAKGEDWKTKEEGLFAITSASKINEVEAIANLIIARITTIIETE